MPTVLVTGANRGLGLEFTKQYLKDGWKVFACCRNPFHAEELNDLAKDYPETLEIEGLDLSDDKLIASFAQDFVSDRPAIDVLINNAGVFGEKQTFEELDFENWEKVFQTNTIAPVKIIKALLNNLEKGQQKKIINITSKMGSIADNSSGGCYIYRSSKVALNMVTKSLAHDLQPKGMTVVAVHPGWVLTDMGGKNALITPQKSISCIRALISNLTPLDSGKFLAFDGEKIDW